MDYSTSYYGNLIKCTIGVFVICCCFYGDAEAQNRFSRSYIDYTYSWYNSGCDEGGTNEYTIDAQIWNDQNGWCQSFNRQCNADLNCINQTNACDRTTSTSHDAARLYSWVRGWEDDTGARSQYNSNGDDCYGVRQCGPYYIYNYTINSWRTDVCDVGGDHRVAMRWYWNYVAVNTPNTDNGVTNNCNSNYLNAVGSTQSNVTWYWQGTNSNGTSTSSPTTSNYNISGNGTYYLRARGNRNGAWSGVRAISVTNYQATAGTASAYGTNAWQHSAYNGSGTYSPSSGNYRGYYTTNALSFNSLDRWCSSCSPEQANGSGGSAYQGCTAGIGVDQHTVVSRRRGFPCGIYRLSMPNHDDNVRVLVDGVNRLQHDGCCDAHNNFWTGYLDGSSTIEVVHREGGGGSHQSLTVTEITSSVNGGSIGSSSTICSGGNLGSFSNNASASGGAIAYSGGVSYQWQSRPGTSGSFSNIGGATGSTYNPPALTSTRQYRRVATDACGNTGTSNTITITVVPDPSISASGATTICTGGSASLSSSTSGGTGSSSYQWQSSPNNSSWTNVSGATGSTYSPSGITSSTYYRVRRISNGNGCDDPYSNSVLVTVVPDPVAPSATSASPSSGSNVCAGQTVSANFNSGSGGTGSCSNQYRYSTNGGGSWSSYTPGSNITVGGYGTTTLIQSRRVCSGSGCGGGGESYSTKVSWNVADNVNPTANCKNASINLNASGNGSVSAGSVNNGSSDNCSVASTSVSPSSFTCSNVGNNTVTLTVTDAAGNSSTCNATVTVNDITNPTAACKNATVQLNAAGNGSVTASAVDNGSSDACGIGSLSVSPSSFTCANVGNNSVTLTVTDNNGNSSNCTATVNVQDNVAPTANCKNATVQLDATGNGSLAASAVNNNSTDACGISGLSVSPSTFDCGNVGGNSVTLTVTDNNGNSKNCTATVTVEDNVAPMLGSCPADQSINTALCQQITTWFSPNSSDACGMASFVYTASDPAATILDPIPGPGSLVTGQFPIGITTVTYTVADVNGNSTDCDFQIEVIDNTPPLIQCPADIDIDTEAGICGAHAFWNFPAYGDNDCTGLTTVAGNGYFSGQVYGVGTVTVEYTATDPSGNQASCSFDITVTDNEAPQITCPADVNVDTDAGICTASNVALGSPSTSDNCAVTSVTNDASEPYSLGATTVTWTAEDAAGNTSTCEQTVTVTDNELPTASCNNLTVSLDAAGAGSITVAQVDDGNTDNCGIASISLSKTDFGCADVGTNSVTLTVTDVNGNANTCNATITVQDLIAPTAVCQNITVALDGTGNAVISANDIDNGSTDACGISSISLSDTEFDCSDVGVNSVTLTVTDANVNSSSCSATVTVQDNEAPTESCADITVQLNAAGTASIGSGDVGSATDNCGISGESVSPSSFDCSHVGDNTVTYTVTDVNGNTSSCNAVVTVEDNINPVAACKNITRDLNAGGMVSITASEVDNGSSDNCNISSISVAPYMFFCSDVGNNTVTLTVNDVNGNSSTCTAIVGINDNIAPAALCQDVTVLLDASGNGSTTAAAVDNGSNDACGIASLSLSQTAFVCSEVGPNAEVLTVTDNNGNVSTCNTTVTVEDNVAPVAVCQNVTVQLDATGNGSTTAAAVDNGSNDACGIASISLSQTSFVCSEVGGNAEVLTVTDNNGNVTTCNTTVTVEDNVAPVAICQNVTVQLDASGNGSTTAAAVDNGSNDACGIASLSLSQTDFGCSEVGPNAEVLTVTDNNGNVTTCNATVTVEDNVAPVALCQDVTVQLDASGNGSTTAAAVDNGSNDACGIASLSLSQTAFVCSEVGPNAEVLTVTDNNGNVTTCNTTVTVEDNVAPVALCQNVTVQLDASGNGSTTAAAVDNGSNDACGIASLSLSQTAFVCSEVGPNAEVLTVTDNNGNVTTCNTTVTVEDNVAPVALCQDVTVQLDASGNGSTTAAAVDNGSNDACGIASLSLSQTAFDCSEVGSNAEVLTVTDNNGNVTTCNTTVTVEDNVAPVAICQDVTVQLDASGNGSTTAAAVDNGSNDACGIASLSLSQTDFVCSEVGPNAEVLTVTDNNGNVTTCNTTVTVEDNVAPVAVCQDVTVQLDASGNGSTTAAAVDNGSNDACGIASISLSQTAFVCSEVGANAETLTVTDNNGNVTTCNATVTVEDNVDPVAICQDVTVQLDASGNGSTSATAVDNSSNDACGIASISLSQTAFVCSEVGSNAEVLTVTDNNGNVSTCNATVTVEDNVDPVAVCQDVTVQLDASGNGSTSATAVDNGSDDACGIASLVLSQTNFDCSEVGDNPEVLTVTDVNGNVSTCNTTVTVEDNVDPNAVCTDITVTLDPTGNWAITAGDVDGGSGDACGLASLSVSPSSFTCAEIGDNTVTLTVTDNNSNVSTCNATVTVIGIVPVVDITRDVLPLFCQGGTYILTANSDVAVQYYNWSTGETTQEIQVNANGTYTVDVTSWTGCVTTESYIVDDYDAGALVSAYTIIGLEEVNLHDEQLVLAGGVGVVDPEKKAKIKDMTVVTDFVQAAEIEIDASSSAGALIYEPSDALIPDFYYNTQPSDNDVKVNNGDNVTLTGCVYDKIDIKKNATVTFTCDNIYIKELKTDDYSTVIFTGSANVFVSKKVDIDKYNSFNPTGETVTMYIEDGLKVKKGTDFHANVYTLKDIHVHADDDDDEETYMTGLFIGEKVHGHKNVTWNWDTNCNPAPLPDLTISCDECKGGVNLIQMVHNGTGTIDVEVTNKDGDVIYYSGTVAEGDTISFEGDGNNNKMDKDTRVYIDGVLNTTIHTSCSQPIGPGAVWGDFTVTYSESVYNGPICPEQQIGARVAATEIATNTYPNPFKDKAIVEFELPEDGQTSIQIITLTGEVIEAHDFGLLKGSSTYNYEFAPKDNVGAGTYLFRIISGEHYATGRMILMK